jgi:predicted O-methyltransferase YrrM
MLSQDLLDYIETINSPEDEVLNALRRETNQISVNPRMLCGNMQGVFLQMVVQMLHPKNILEIGTFTGYSAICMARGLSGDANLISIDKNDEISWMSRKYISLSGLHNRINLVVADALEWLPNYKKQFDFVYIDGDKSEYPRYYNMVMPLLKKGGFIIADNVLWGNKIIQQAKQNDKMLIGVQQFNQLIASDGRVEQVILPIRDGLMLIRKS